MATDLAGVVPEPTVPTAHELDGLWPTERWRAALARGETWDEVLQEVQGGKTLGRIAFERGWPRFRFRSYVLQDGELRAQYLAAREMAGDEVAVEGRELLKLATNKTLPVVNAQANYDKWLASKWDRGTYGDSVRVEQAVEVTLALRFGVAEGPVVAEQVGTEE